MLFVLELSAYLLLSQPKPVVLIASALCVCGTVYLRNSYPFALWHVLCAFPFFIGGFLCRKYLLPLPIQPQPKGRQAAILVAICVLSFLLLAFVTPHYSVNLHGLYNENIYWLYLNAFIGIAFTISLSMLLSSLRYFSYLGQNTMIILCLHYYATRYYLTPLLWPYCKKPWITLVQFLLTFTLIWLLMLFEKPIKKYVPFLFGLEKHHAPLP